MNQWVKLEFIIEIFKFFYPGFIMCIVQVESTKNRILNKPVEIPQAEVCRTEREGKDEFLCLI